MMMMMNDYDGDDNSSLGSAQTKEKHFPHRVSHMAVVNHTNKYIRITFLVRPL